MTKTEVPIRRSGSAPSPPVRRTDWRLVTSLALLAGLGAAFWLTSRYPALSEKALIAGEVEAAGQVGFDSIITVNPGDPLLWRVAGNAVNWLWVNRQGMAFGIAFGAVMLTALSLVKRRSFRSATANTALGVVIGAPLGVCVNCAAPISHAMRRGGARAETALAAMFSSPTYNVVVISIALSLLPGYMVLMKLGLTLAFILLVVPRLARQVPDTASLPHTSGRARRLFGEPLGENFDVGMPVDDETPEQHRGLVRSVGWVVLATIRNLWEVARLAVPLMLLAAVVGSFIVTVLPFDELIGYLPSERVISIVAALVLVSAIGLVLPMPIAFDVVLAGSLWAAGLPPRYVMALFFTLGIYSIYSALVVAAVFSPRVAWLLAVPLLALGVVVGFGAEAYLDWRDSREQGRIEDMLANLTSTSVSAAPVASSTEEILALLDGNQVVFEPIDIGIAGDVMDVALARAPFALRRDAMGTFARIPGTELGLDDRPRVHPAHNLYWPFGAFGGIAAGDVHGDGWDDLLVTSDFGVTLYANVGGSFEAQEVADGALMREFGVVAALVDLDDDAQLDIVATFADGTNIAVLNEGAGRFDAASILELPGHDDDGALVWAIAAGDLDRNGRLDLVAGWWSQHQGTAVNQVWSQTDSGGFDVVQLTGPPGQTLSVLATDLTGDGWVDVMVGNDFAEPDVVYRNDGTGGLVEVRSGDGLLPHSTTSTMAVTTGDIDNDLDMDVYVAQISNGLRGGDRDLLIEDDGSDWCGQFGNAAPRERCQLLFDARTALETARRERSLIACEDLDGAGREACLAAGTLRSRFYRSPDVCGPLDAAFPVLAGLCRSFSVGGQRRIEDDTTKPVEYGGEPGDLPSVPGRNVLLVNAGNEFDDEAEARGLDTAGWVWDTSLFDADHDGDLDMSVMNGSLSVPAQSNMFFRNEAGHFVDDTEPSEFVDYSTSLGSAVVDLDNDGDLDIITIPNDGPPAVFRNELARGSALILELAVPAGTVAAGTRVVVETPDGQSLLREVTVGGGYLGFDAPTVHFGLGAEDGPVTAHIRWTDGSTTVLDGLDPGYRYRVTAR